MNKNQVLLKAVGEFNKSNWFMKLLKKNNLRKIAKERKDYLKSLIVLDRIEEVSELLFLFGPVLPEEIQEYLEKFVSAQGEYSLICHNYKSHGETVGYIAVGKGKDKKNYRLASTKDNSPDNQTGEEIEVTGHILDEYLVLGAKPSGTGGGKGKPKPTPTPDPTPTPSGAKKIAYFMINFQDKACPFTDPVFLQNVTTQISNLYNETSFGAITFTSSVHGPYTIPNLSTEACNFQAWSDAADLVINASGFDRTVYTNLVYLFPGTGCGIGYGTVGGNPAKTWIFRDYLDLFGHELGHNLGMQHAGDPGNQYNDYSDIMGWSGVGLRQVNAPHKIERGWVPSTSVQYISIRPMAVISKLMALEVNPSLGQQVITLNKTDTNELYYVCFRATIGFDQSLSSTHANKVNIYRKANTTGAVQTYFVCSLSDGEIFHDVINNLRVTAISHTDNSADVKIELL